MIRKHSWHYIDLDRQFIDYSGDIADPEVAALQSYLAGFYGHSRGFGWDKLLESRYVVVLGEPGSGKSVELEQRAEFLQRQGIYAFFVRLDQLVNGPLHGGLESGDQALFRQWRRRRDQATFFLDSVDETKLVKIEAFSDALRHFTQEIGERDLERCRLIISSRISEWRAEADRVELQRTFQMIRPGGG